MIGAGLTGVSSAAHAIAHGFDVVIYEQDDKVGECISTHQGKLPCYLRRLAQDSPLVLGKSLLKARCSHLQVGCTFMMRYLGQYRDLILYITIQVAFGRT